MNIIKTLYDYAENNFKLKVNLTEGYYYLFFAKIDPAIELMNSYIMLEGEGTSGKKIFPINANKNYLVSLEYSFYTPLNIHHTGVLRPIIDSADKSIELNSAITSSNLSAEIDGEIKKEETGILTFMFFPKNTIIYFPVLNVETETYMMQVEKISEEFAKNNKNLINRIGF